MGQLKKLASQTAIYGLPTIVGRLLNYLLVPLYTRTLPTEQYGVVTDLYAMVALLMALLTYGMETAFFRYAQEKGHEKTVYSTAFMSLLFTSLGFLSLCLFFKQPIAAAIGYASFSEYIVIFALILSLDAIKAIPYALLRQQQRPIRFAAVKSIEISTVVLLNLFFLLLCPYLLKCGISSIEEVTRQIYNPEHKILYIFVSNLLASIISFLCLAPQMIQIQFRIHTKLWKEMLVYAIPIMLGSLAGIINEAFDRMILKHLIPIEQNPMAQLGIYGACYKISIIMSLFIQAFRFAAEPFFFQRAKHNGAQQTYAIVTKYFTMICSTIFLAVMLYINFVAKFVGPDYRVGIKVVPILLLANLFLGIYYNLSIWYKLTDKVIFGAIIGAIGAAITIALNFLLIPHFGYMGSAYATFACYFSIMIISYVLGQKYYPIPYTVGKNIAYIVAAVVIYYISTLFGFQNPVLHYGVNTILLLSYLGYIYKFELQKDLQKRVL